MFTASLVFNGSLNLYHGIFFRDVHSCSFKKFKSTVYPEMSHESYHLKETNESMCLPQSSLLSQFSYHINTSLIFLVLMDKPIFWLFPISMVLSVYACETPLGKPTAIRIRYDTLLSFITLKMIYTESKQSYQYLILWWSVGTFSQYTTYKWSRLFWQYLHQLKLQTLY